MRSERFDFPNSKGERLAALLDLPLGNPTAFALFAHCFTCGKDILAAKRIAEQLTMHGVGVLRFDFTGLGGSEGEFANTQFSSNVDDLIAAADHLRKSYAAPTILIGHSLGGTAMLAALDGSDRATAYEGDARSQPGRAQQSRIQRRTFHDVGRGLVTLNAIVVGQQNGADRIVETRIRDFDGRDRLCLGGHVAPHAQHVEQALGSRRQRPGTDVAVGRPPLEITPIDQRNARLGAGQ